jgi:hypothetical protein
MMVDPYQEFPEQDLIEICEGNKDTAQLITDLIKEIDLVGHAPPYGDHSQRKIFIANLYQTRLEGFEHDDNRANSINFEHAISILDAMDEKLGILPYQCPFEGIDKDIIMEIDPNISISMAETLLQAIKEIRPYGDTREFGELGDIEDRKYEIAILAADLHEDRYGNTDTDDELINIFTSVLDSLTP